MNSGEWRTECKLLLNLVVARIRTEKNGGAWCPKSQISRDVYEWIQVDLGELKVVTQVETQGRFGNGQVRVSLITGQSQHSSRDSLSCTSSIVYLSTAMSCAIVRDGIGDSGLVTDWNSGLARVSQFMRGYECTCYQINCSVSGCIVLKL